MATAVAGVVAGLAAALALTRFLQPLLFGIDAIDFPTFGLGAALVFSTAFIAAWIPARRAVRIDPARSLRAG